MSKREKGETKIIKGTFFIRKHSRAFLHGGKKAMIKFYKIRGGNVELRQRENVAPL